MRWLTVAVIVLRAAAAATLTPQDTQTNDSVVWSVEAERLREEHSKDHFYSQLGVLGVNYDMDGGKPYVRCKYMNRSLCDPRVEKCETEERCYIKPNRRNDRVACMAVLKIPTTDQKQAWKENYPAEHPLVEPEELEVQMQGCWNHEADNMKSQCADENKCVMRGSVLFCCCTSHLCNARILVNRTAAAAAATSNNQQADLRAAEDSKREKLQDWIATVFSAGMIAIAGCAVCVVAITMAKKGRDGKKPAHASHTGGDQSELLLNKVYAAPDKNLRVVRHEQMLPAGHFGVVHRSRMRPAAGGEGDETTVAVKVVTDQKSWMCEQDLYSLESIRREAGAMFLRFHGAECRLAPNPHYGNRYNEPELSQQYWLFLEFLPLGSLYDYIQTHTLSADQALKIISTTLSGLSYLHEEREIEKDVYKPTIVHRDMKSRNILLRSDMTAVIADFGLAMKYDSECIDKEAPGQVGTLIYMAPEVLEGATGFSAAAFRQIDVYATAIVMWEVLSRTEIDKGEVLSAYRRPFDDLGSVMQAWPSPWNGVGVGGAQVSEQSATQRLPPRLDQMREAVCGKKMRPSHPDRLKRERVWRAVCDTIDEMWEHESDGRITAGCAFDRIQVLDYHPPRDFDKWREAEECAQYNAVRTDNPCPSNQQPAPPLQAPPMERGRGGGEQWEMRAIPRGAGMHQETSGDTATTQVTESDCSHGARLIDTSLSSGGFHRGMTSFEQGVR